MHRSCPEVCVVPCLNARPAAARCDEVSHLCRVSAVLCECNGTFRVVPLARWGLSSVATCLPTAIGRPLKLKLGHE